MLYSAQDFQTAKRRSAGARASLALLIVLLFAAGLLPMLLSRNMLFSIIFSTAFALLAVFLYGMVFSPLFAYRRFMRSAEDGIRHEFSGVFEGNGGESVRDGVRFISMSFRVSQDEEPRLCYFDASLADAGLTQGREYQVTHTGNSILALRPAGEGKGAKGDG